FYYNNKNYHHILDPSTGTPSDSGFDSVSVISSSSLEADCLSTACLVLGETDGTKLANKFNAKTYWIKQRSN
ncbi:MAG: FAD:protein FMN transferase, partial [Monoglobus pectinilyticus]